MLLVTQAAVVSLDLVAAQCLAPGSPCLARTVPDWLRETYLVRPLIGLVPVLLLIYVLYRISCVAWETEAGIAANPPPTPPNARVLLPGTNLVADPDTPTLRALHLVAALATVALLPLGGPFSVPAGRPRRAVGARAGAAGGRAAGRARAGRPARRAPGAGRSVAARGARAGDPAGAAGARRRAGGAAAAAQDPLPSELTGTDSTVEAVAAVLIVLVVLFGVLLVPAALIARREWRARPRQLRPWAGGWMAAPVLAVAALLGGGFGAGLAVAVQQAARAAG